MALLSRPVLTAGTPPGAFSSKKNLLDLPTELRLMIYGFIIAKWNFASEYAYYSRRRSSTRASDPAFRLQFLRTCRLIYEEAKGMAYSVVTFVFPSIPFDSNFAVSEHEEKNKQVVARVSSLRHIPTLKSLGFRYYDIAMYNGYNHLGLIQELAVFQGLEKVYLLDHKQFRPHIVNLINTVFTLIEVYPALNEIYFIGFGLSSSYDRVITWDKFRTMFDNRLLLPNGKYRRAFYDEWDGAKMKKKMYKWPGECTKKFGDGTEASFVVNGRTIKFFAWSMAEVEGNVA